MSLNLSFFGKTVLVSSTDEALGRLIVTTLNQIGFADVVFHQDVDEAIGVLSSNNYDLVICSDVDFGEAVSIARRLRTEPKNDSPTPIICVIAQLDTTKVNMALNCGANCLMLMPITSRTMLKNVRRAMDDPREFVTSDEYRGPCRRVADSRDSYDGPRRRASDRSQRNSAAHGTAAPRPQRDGHAQQAEPNLAASPGSASPVRTRPARPNRQDDDFSTESLGLQTEHVIQGINDIAGRIEYLKQTLNAADDDDTRRIVRTQIMEAAQRLVNLMLLVDMNKAHTRNKAFSARIAEVRRLFVDILWQMSHVRLDAIQGEIEKSLAGQALVMGRSEQLQQRLASVEEILAVIGHKGIDQEIDDKLDKAWKGIEDVLRAEAEHFNLPDLARSLQRHQRPSRPPRPKTAASTPAPPPAPESAASQNAVAQRLRSKREGGDGR
ncbi:hypothetical protein [Magnetospirillum sp. UT-4]|uniref:hypothetical protein n=1 Tax=Magnetospirillum sp. UT-4 TaxID=2681467 RepID=UPI00157200D2|nr:hypothetical protein [Magnetospirillum sp. UT-4]